MHRAFTRSGIGIDGFITAILVTVTHRPVRAADKLRVAYVAPSVSLSLPWLAKESGILAKHDLGGGNSADYREPTIGPVTHRR